MSGFGTEDKRSLTILWRIENFSYSKHGFHQYEISTSLFRPRILDGRPCYLRMCPKGENIGDIRLRLSFILLAEALGYMINCEWSFLDSDGSPLASGTVQNQVARRYTPLILSGCPTKKDVFETRKSSFLPHDTLTVRFRIWKSLGEFPEAERFTILTRVHVEEHSFLWPVQNFGTLHLHQNVTKPVHLPSFPHVKDAVEMKFALTGPSLLNSTVNCEIKNNQNCHPALVKFKASVLDTEQEAMACGEQTLELSSSNSVACIPTFVSRRELLVKRSKCLRGDVLNLLCALTYFKGDYRSIIERTYLGPSNLERVLRVVGSPDIPREAGDSLVTLGYDFLSLYRDRNLSDFELRSGDSSFPVHKLVLGARSPFFRELFSSYEKFDLNFLEIPDVNDATLQRMLTFLYSGAVDDLQWEDAAKLHYAAYKYQVPSLKRECSVLLRSSISVSNVCDILVLADGHRDHDLTAFVHDFILDHYDDVMVSDEWGTFLESESYLAGITVSTVSQRRRKVKK